MLNWRDAKKIPPEGSCLVVLAEPLYGMKVHGAIFRSKGSMIGGLFAYDCPKVIWWVPEEEVRIPAIKEEIENENCNQ